MAQELFANNALTTLASGITNVQTSITVADGSAMPSPTGGDYFRLVLTQAATETLWEVVKVTARSGNTLTVTRGQDGTTARAWSSGDKAECRLSAGSLGDMAQKSGADFSGAVSVIDGSFSIKGSSDATKIAKFEVDGFTTGTTRTVTLPDADIVAAGSAAALTSGRIPAATTGGLLTNTFLASTVSGNTATFAGAMGAARVFTLPDASITLAGSASALTSGRVPYATAGGLLTDDSGFAIIGAAAVDGLRRLNFDNTGSGASRHASIGIRTNSSNIEALFFGVNQTTSAIAYIDNCSGGPLQIQGSGSAILTCYASGGVHVGSTPADPGSGVLSVQGQLKSAQAITATGASGAQLIVQSTQASTSTTTGCATFAGGIGVAGAGWFGANTNIVTTGGTSYLIVRGDAGYNRGVLIQTGSSLRWGFAAGSAAESGSDAGSAFAISAYNDSGSFIDSPISIVRASAGAITLGGSTNRKVAITGTTASTSTTTGALIVAGGAGIAGKINAGGDIVTGYNGNAALGAFGGSAAGSYVVWGDNGLAKDRWYAVCINSASARLEFQALNTAGSVIDSPMILENTAGGAITFGGSTNRTLATTGGRIEKVSTITGNTTLDGTYHNVLCNSASAFTVTLPAAASNSGRVYVITNINSGTVTIDANASETINGALTQALLQWQCVKILCNGSNWFIL